MNKYLINHIIEYASNDQFKFKLNLLNYSKLFQKQLDIDLNDYKYNYFEKIHIVYSYSRVSFIEELKNNKKNFI